MMRWPRSAARTSLCVFASVAALCGCSDGEPTAATAQPTLADEPAIATAQAPVSSAEDRPTVVWVGGDVLPSGALRRSARDTGDLAAGYAEILEPAAAMWRRDEPNAFVVVNLETPIARTTRISNNAFTKTKQGARLVQTPLNGEVELLQGLKRVGVDAVTLANNHTLDQGREGLAETIEASHTHGLVTLGAGLAPNLAWPAVIGPDGATTAVFSFFEKDFPEPALDNGRAGLAVLDDESVYRVQEAAQQNRAVIIIIHVVAEMFVRVKDRWERWATRFAQAGAAAVAFHGTHVAGPVRTIQTEDGRQVPVAYHLGNLLSDMGASATPSRRPPSEIRRWESPEPRESLLMRVEIRPDDVTVSFVLLWLHQDRWLINNRVRRGRIEFALLPLAPCGLATSRLAAWPQPWGAQMEAWIGTRRDHLLEVTGLNTSSCTPGRVAPVPAASAR